MKFKLLLTMVLASLVIMVGCSNNNNTLVNKNLNDEVALTENNVNNTNSNSEPVESTEDLSAEETIEDPSEMTIGSGYKIPDFKMPTLEGEIIQPSDYEGKIVVLNFWASWCGYCDKEMPDLDIIDKEDDVVVIAVNAQESKAIVEEYIKDGGYEFLTVLDEDGLFSNVFAITSLPTTYFIGKDGLLVGAVPSMLTLDQMQQILEDIRSLE